jgi:hypothetical protein
MITCMRTRMCVCLGGGSGGVSGRSRVNALVCEDKRNFPLELQCSCVFSICIAAFVDS